MFLPLAQQPLESQGLLVIETSRSHSIRHTTLVGLLWTSCQSGSEICTWQHTTLTSDRYTCPGGIRTHNPSKPAAAHPRLRPRDQCDRQHGAYFVCSTFKNSTVCLPSAFAYVYYDSSVQKQPVCFYNTNEMCLLCDLYLKYNSDQFYQTKLCILPVIVARSMSVIVSPCTWNYETQNAMRLACVLHHLNYLKIESVAQLCDVSHKMTISASGTYFCWRNVFHFKYFCKLRVSRRLCKTLTRGFLQKFLRFLIF